MLQISDVLLDMVYCHGLCWFKLECLYRPFWFYVMWGVYNVRPHRVFVIAVSSCDFLFVLKVHV